MGKRGGDRFYLSKKHFLFILKKKGADMRFFKVLFLIIGLSWKAVLTSYKSIMKRLSFRRTFFCSLFIFLLLTSCAHAPKQEDVKKYTAYNMWYEKSNVMYCVNYQRGKMLPAGTEVQDVAIYSHLFLIAFQTVKNLVTYYIESDKTPYY
jgi:hypothetical protein